MHNASKYKKRNQTISHKIYDIYENFRQKDGIVTFIIYSSYSTSNEYLDHSHFLDDLLCMKLDIYNFILLYFFYKYFRM